MGTNIKCFYMMHIKVKLDRENIPETWKTLNNDERNGKKKKVQLILDGAIWYFNSLSPKKSRKLGVIEVDYVVSVANHNSTCNEPLLYAESILYIFKLPFLIIIYWFISKPIVCDLFIF